MTICEAEISRKGAKDAKNHDLGALGVSIQVVHPVSDPYKKSTQCYRLYLTGGTKDKLRRGVDDRHNTKDGRVEGACA